LQERSLGRLCIDFSNLCLGTKARCMERLVRNNSLLISLSRLFVITVGMYCVLSGLSMQVFADGHKVAIIELGGIIAQLLRGTLRTPSRQQRTLEASLWL